MLMAKSKVYNFRLSEKEIAFIDRWATREGKSRSEIVRSTIEAFGKWQPDLLDRIAPEILLALKDPDGP